MQKGILFAIICLIVIALVVMTLLNQKQGLVRQPAVAGAFYPAEPDVLRAEVDKFLANATSTKKEVPVLGLIVPHAGYQFSGGVAGFSYKVLENEKIDTVILIGNSHQEYFDGISIFPQGFYQTPLGKVEIDSDLAQVLTAESKRIFFRETAHSKEHSLEVQLPFLQKVLEDFKILPIIFGNSPNEGYKVVAQALLKHAKGKKVVFVASSDLSHYPPGELAREADLKTLEAISTGSIENLENTIKELESQNIPQAVTFACGVDAIKTVMAVAAGLGANKIEILKYQNSGDVSGDTSQVVGYGAVAFYKQPGKTVEQVLGETGLTKEDKAELLEIAKASVEGALRQGKVPEFQVASPALNQKLGAFVTIKKNGQLRGCIGHFGEDIPLYKVVSQMAVSAAFYDSRFFPVQESELPNLKYEISVLSPLQKIDDWQEIEIGKHGVQIVSGTRSGVFLPQVATDNNWGLEKFMGELCSQKAGLAWDYWKREEVDLYTFTAEVFGEEE